MWIIATGEYYQNRICKCRDLKTALRIKEYLMETDPKDYMIFEDITPEINSVQNFIEWQNENTSNN
jgi:hypothetical protein